MYVTTYLFGISCFTVLYETNNQVAICDGVAQIIDGGAHAPLSYTPGGKERKMHDATKLVTDG